MSTNLNLINSSCISNGSSRQKSLIERTGSTSFATQLESAKKTDTYIDEIKNFVPNTTVTIKSMNAGDVQKYYEEWKKQPVDYSGLKPNITVSPKVLEKMEKDPEYAEKMLLKIKKAATPEGFGNATIYEYKVIVRDDGEIETLACADFMNEKKQKINNDDDEKKKDEKKKNELIYSNIGIDDQWKTKTVSVEDIKGTQFIDQQYLLNIEIFNKKRR